MDNRAGNSKPDNETGDAWVAKWQMECDDQKELARRHAAYGGMLYAKHLSRWDTITEMLESYRLSRSVSNRLLRRLPKKNLRVCSDE